VSDRVIAALALVGAITIGALALIGFVWLMDTLTDKANRK
jgi:hypothetical protein